MSKTSAGGSEQYELLTSQKLHPDTAVPATEDEVTATTWWTEVLTLTKYCAPIFCTNVLQRSTLFVSIAAAGTLGRCELAAVSLATATAKLTGDAIYQGLATALDTLCSQAYGAGDRALVGLFIQRMILLLLLISLPISMFWVCSTDFFSMFLPNDEKHVAVLAGTYLKVLPLGLPAYILYETLQRYLYTKGQFRGTTYVLTVAAPCNLAAHWLLVWYSDLGVLGCGLAVVITNNLMAILLLLYIRAFSGLDCWPPFSHCAYTDWWPMIQLALPGMFMLLADYASFEVLAVAASQISAAHLAANAIIQLVGMMAFQLPFAFSVGASTRVGILVGQCRPQAARKSSKVIFTVGLCLGAFSMVSLATLRRELPRPFTQDFAIAALVSSCLPVNAAFQLFNSVAAQFNGILKGLGRQKVGGYIHVAAFLACGIPISLILCFGLRMALPGLWLGPAAGLTVVSIGEGWAVYATSFQQVVVEAGQRTVKAALTSHVTAAGDSSMTTSDHYHDSAQQNMTV